MKYIPDSDIIKKDQLSKRLETLDFDIFTFGFWKQTDTAYLSNEILSSYKLVCITAGSCTVYFSKKEYYLKQGDCIIIAPFVLFTALCTGEIPVEYCYFLFDVKEISQRELFRELFHCETVTVFSEAVPASAVPLIRMSYESLLGNRMGYYYSIKLVFQRMMLNIQRASRAYQRAEGVSHRHSSVEKTVSACVHYLNQNLSGRVTVDELCKKLHVSQSYLYQSFMEVTGMSTKEFMDTYKLKRIEVELKQSDTPIRNISEQYGYSSVNAFSSQFKKYYGISPLQYRKKYLVSLK